MSALTDLLARVEAAEGPDRELDVHIHAALNHASARPYPPSDDFGPKNRWQFWSLDGHHFLAAEAEHLGTKWYVPRYTASLDAVIALLERKLPGVMWQVGFDPDDGSMCARLVTVPPPCTHVKANHDTAVLATVAALLKALIAQEAQQHEGGR